MKCKTHLVILSLLLLPFLSVSGRADSFTCTTICTHVLSNTNISTLPAGSVAVQVTVDNTGATTKLIVQWLTNNTPFTALGIHAISYNSSVQVSGISNNTTSWHFNFGGSNVDGFGSFASHHNLGGGNEQGGLLSPGNPLIFTLDGKVTNWIANNNGSVFVVHIRFSNGCSGFISDGISTGIEANANCAFSPPPVVPEPSSLVLLGSGLAMVAGFFRRLTR